MIDDTPHPTRQYWIAQHPRYAETMNDPDFLEEQQIKLGRARQDYKQYLPQDPSHPRAYVPDDVRFAKRKDQQFRCAITGWHETDWVRDKPHQGPIRKVGILTVEHVIAGANGGKTTDENIRMVCEFVNSKKGDRKISYEQMRERVLGVYEIVEPPEELEQMLMKYNIREYKI